MSDPFIMKTKPTSPSDQGSIYNPAPQTDLTEGYKGACLLASNMLADSYDMSLQLECMCRKTRLVFVRLSQGKGDF